MSDRYDFIAIGPMGVYALCEDLPEHQSLVREFIDGALMRGDRVERVPVSEACDRHRKYLRKLPAFVGLPLAPRPTEGNGRTEERDG